MAEPSGDNPGVIALPPLIYGGFLAVGLLLDHFIPSPVVASDLRYALAGALIAAGVGVALLGARQLRRAGTNISVHLPATALVTDGIYAVTRNPLYLSLLLAYWGIGIASNGVWMLALSIPLILVIRFGVIAREERYLEGKFGDAYRRYKTRVRRWI